MPQNNCQIRETSKMYSGVFEDQDCGHCTRVCLWQGSRWNMDAVLYGPAGGAVMQCFESFCVWEYCSESSIPWCQPVYFIYSKVKKLIRLLVIKVVHMGKNHKNLLEYIFKSAMQFYDTCLICFNLLLNDIYTFFFINYINILTLIY